MLLKTEGDFLEEPSVMRSYDNLFYAVFYILICDIVKKTADEICD